MTSFNKKWMKKYNTKYTNTTQLMNKIDILKNENNKIMTNKLIINNDVKNNEDNNKSHFMKNPKQETKNIELIPTRYIDKVQFNLLSSEDIINLSIGEINESNLEGDKFGTLKDPRMGAYLPDMICNTCNSDMKDCPGHFGHITLNIPVIHPLMMDYCINYLKMFCQVCSRLCITKEEYNIHVFKNHTEFVKYLKEVEVCPRCNNFQFDIQKAKDSRIYFKNNKDKYYPEIQRLYDILNNINVEDLNFLKTKFPHIYGKDFHPIKTFIKILPVIPTCARPFVKLKGKEYGDEFTTLYINIIKANNKLKPKLKFLGEKKLQDQYDILVGNIKTLFNNSSQISVTSNSTKPFKSIKDCIEGKKGRVRNNLNGKRTFQSGRTVIGPDPNLEVDQLAIPEEIAKTLYIRVKVTSYNIKFVRELAEKGKILNVLKKKKDSIYDDIDLDYNVFSYSLIKDKEIHLGDIVERQLLDNDLVLLNRQPTLNRGSMRVKRIKILPGRTFRFSLSSCKPFNAD